jgi:hypothetical protein
MRLNKVPKVYHPIINSIKRKAKRNRISIRFGITKTVHQTDLDYDGCGGYFTYDGKYGELAVAMDKPLYKWITTFIHESCHMDQQFDKSIADKNVVWLDACLMYFEWLGGTRQLNKAQVQKYMYLVIEMERDCEERAVKKIIKFNLPINIKEYIQQSNTYVLGYKLITEKRKWYNYIYNAEEVWRTAPNTFVDIYLPLHPPLEKALRIEIAKREII